MYRLIRRVGLAADRSLRLLVLTLTRPTGDLALSGTARTLLDWHARLVYCSVRNRAAQNDAGALVAPVRMGFPRVRRAPFPRLNPPTIMLLEFKGVYLIGRQAGLKGSIRA